ncbi:MAG: hypothetical protein LBT05_03910 [Planctomycetaceae bacterium]|jgi:hypothetical protein|nr:hypothetical protein [Planctomycetaceae bacterium]
MSYSVSFYLADIQKLQKILDEKDLSILDEMSFDENEEDDWENRAYLEKLMTGSEPDDEDEPFEYAYSLEQIVAHLFGESVPVPEFEDLRIGKFEGVLSWILKSGSPIKLPPNDDYPYVGHRFLPEIQKMLNDWNDKNFEEYAPKIQTMIKAMFRIFRTAVKQKKDVITFYY